jgi:cobalt-zinc-cadmium efflux system outer membrane protein
MVLHSHRVHSSAGPSIGIAAAVGFAAWLCPLGALLAQGASIDLSGRPFAAPPTLPDVVSFALQNNPDIAIARFQVDSAHGERRIARGFPNPTFAVAPGNPYQYTVNQPVDVGPSRVYRTRAAAQGESAVRLDVENVTRQVVFTVRRGFLDLQLAEAVREIAFAQDTIVRHLLQSDSLRFHEGDLALRDLSITELQFAHAESNLAHADAAAREARINLQVLMGVRHPDTSFRVGGALAYRAMNLSLDSLRAIALVSRPDLAAARERVDQSRTVRSLSHSLVWPVPGVAAVYQPQQPFSSGSNYALGISLSVPVFYWFGGERQRANAGLRSAEVASGRTLANVEGDVASATDDLRAARTLAARYAAGLLDKAREAVEMQRFAYEHGNASLLDLLNAINAFGDTQTDYYTAVHDYWVAAYAIDQAVGRDLVP